MWELKVAGWWVLRWALLLGGRSLVWLLYLPMKALEVCADGLDVVEWEWLLACTQMRLARRRRLNFKGEVGDGQRG